MQFWPRIISDVRGVFFISVISRLHLLSRNNILSDTVLSTALVGLSTGKTGKQDKGENFLSGSLKSFYSFEVNVIFLNLT